MNKIILIKRTSAIFLAIVLATGTIATILPSFMTTEEVQAQPYYDDRMDNDYNSYGPTDYGMDNDRKSYDNSYYKSQYSSYDKHDRDKSKKDSKKSVSINKLNCINTNLNINGNNTGDINVGNRGAGVGYVGDYSSGNSGGYDGVGYYDGHNNNKKDKGFDCIINNNNTNTNVVSNVTDDDGADDNGVVEECVICFIQANVRGPIEITAEILSDLEEDLGIVLDLVEGEELTILDLCRLLEGLDLTEEEFRELIAILGIPIPDDDEAPDVLDTLIRCLIEAGIIIEVDNNS